MAPLRIAGHKHSAYRMNLRTCVLFSVLLHVLLFYIPYHQSKVQAMSGSMSMVIAAGSGKPGQSAAAPKAVDGPAKPKAVAERKILPQENKNVPENKPEPVVHPQRKPVPVQHRQAVMPPKPKPKTVVRQQPVKQVPPVKTAAEKPRKKNVSRDRAEKRVRKKVVAQPMKNAPSSVAKTAAAEDQKSTQTTMQSAGNPGQGKNAAKAVKAGGGTPKGPIQARFGSLHGPKVTRWMRPKYPRKARDMGETGLVVLRITIDANGHPVSVEIAQKAGSGFDEAALAAARKSAFAPATHKGRPVACIALLPVRFNLKGQ